MRVKDDVTPMKVNATHRRFWHYIKDKALRVIQEDKTEYMVADEEGEQYRIRKEFAEVITSKPKEATLG